MLTLEQLKSLPPESIIAQGIIENSPEGIYMTNDKIGKKLIWVAKRGVIHDWAIYVSWEENGLQYALDFGDKLYDEKHIKKLVPCTEEAFKMYRF